MSDKLRYRKWAFTLYPKFTSERLPQLSGDNSSPRSEENDNWYTFQEDCKLQESDWLRCAEILYSKCTGLGASFCICSVEICPRTQRHHLQGYIRFTHSVRIQHLKDVGSTIHWTRCNGTEEENINYCSKEETHLFGPFTFGKKTIQGKRNDISQVREIINTGGRMSTVVDTIDSYQAIKFGEIFLKYKEPVRLWKPDVKWFHGATGTGKTRAALELFPNAWISMKSLRWWEGYDGHEDVIIDDFRKDFCTFHELLRILDRYPYRIEVKGCSRQLLAKNIVVTCPYRPEIIYNNRVEEDINQLLRRIDEIRLFGDRDVEPPLNFISLEEWEKRKKLREAEPRL